MELGPLSSDLALAVEIIADPLAAFPYSLGSHVPGFPANGKKKKKSLGFGTTSTCFEYYLKVLNYSGFSFFQRVNSFVNILVFSSYLDLF